MAIAEGTLGCIWIFGHQSPIYLQVGRKWKYTLLQIIRGVSGNLDCKYPDLPF